MSRPIRSTNAVTPGNADQNTNGRALARRARLSYVSDQQDLRTWKASALVADELLHAEPPTSARRAKAAINAALDAAAAVLGNTRAVCRRSYVHPSLLKGFAGGRLQEAFRGWRPRANRLLSRQDQALARWLRLSYGTRSDKPSTPCCSAQFAQQ